MEIFLSLISASLCTWIIYRCPFFKIEGIWKHAIAVVFVAKLLSALVLTLLYTFYYTDRGTADIFKYFDDAKVISSALPQHPWDFVRLVTGINIGAPDLQPYLNRFSYWYKEFDHRLYNDNRTLIRYNALVMLFSLGHFFVHNVVMSFLSLCGLMGIYRVFASNFPGKKRELLVAIFLLPSVMLWTSGVMKEGLVIFAFGLAFYLAWKILYDKCGLMDVVMLALLVGLLSITKYYVLFCAVPGFLYLVLMKWGKIKSHLLAATIAVGVCVLFLLVNHEIGGKHDVIETLAYKQMDFLRFTKSLDNVGSYIETDSLKPTVRDFVTHSPVAFYNSVFKPEPWNIKNILSVIPAFENIILVMMIVFMAFTFTRPRRGAEIICFSVLFFLFLNVLNGLIVPVVGALVRYKVPAMPFLFATIVCLSDYERLKAAAKAFINRPGR